MQPDKAQQILEALPKSGLLKDADPYVAEFPNGAEPLFYTRGKREVTVSRDKNDTESAGETITVGTNNGSAESILGAVASSGFLDNSAPTDPTDTSPHLEPLSITNATYSNPHTTVMFKDHNPQK